MTVEREGVETLEAGLFERYAEAIRGLPSGEFAIRDLRCERFQLQAEGLVEIYYTPFDHVNENALVTLVGITPGWHQMRLAYTVARDLLREGLPHNAILARVSSIGVRRFVGPRRRASGRRTLVGGAIRQSALSPVACARGVYK
jgi:hypothetical protein